MQLSETSHGEDGNLARDETRSMYSLLDRFHFVVKDPSARNALL